MSELNKVATAATVVVIGAALSLAGCGQHSPSGAIDGPAQWGPQLEGTITSIQPGPSTQVTLSHVQEALTTDGKFHHYASVTVTIGPGQWVAPQHWRGSHDSMDLFVGEAIVANPRHIARTIAGQINGYSGIIRRIQGNLVTLQKTKYVGDNSTGHAIDRLMPVLSTFHIAPYSQFSWEGGTTPPFSASQLKVGQYVDGLWEGAASYPIVDQWTIFPSDKAFDGSILESPQYAKLTHEPPPTSPSGGAPQPSGPSSSPSSRPSVSSTN